MQDSDSEEFYECASSACVNQPATSEWGGRCKLPAKMIATKEISLFSILKQCIGKELSKITMPIYFNEPISFLQRLVEHMEYVSLLQEAARCDDATKRFELITAFAVSGLASTKDRTGKPFNPLLGETFEYSRDDNGGYTIVCEQVSHHPPISAFHASSQDYSFYGYVQPQLKFWGRSVDVVPGGTMTVTLDNYNEVYWWQSVNCCVHNIILGEMWVEQHGNMVISEHNTQHVCRLTFHPTGWFSKEAHRVTGVLYDDKGATVRSFVGKWENKFFSLNTDDLEMAAKVILNNLEDDSINNTNNNEGNNKNNVEEKNKRNSIEKNEKQKEKTQTNDKEEKDGKEEKDNVEEKDEVKEKDEVEENDESNVNDVRGKGSSNDESKPGLDDNDDVEDPNSSNNPDVVSTSNLKPLKSKNGSKPKVSAPKMHFIKNKMLMNAKTNPKSVTKRKASPTALKQSFSQLCQLWAASDKPSFSREYYGFTSFTMHLNQLADNTINLPPTDSRFRPDIRYMENGHIEKASEEKVRLEEKQREVRRTSKGVQADPCWFTKGIDQKTGLEMWLFHEEYFDRDWKLCPDIY